MFANFRFVIIVQIYIHYGPRSRVPKPGLLEDNQTLISREELFVCKVVGVKLSHGEHYFRWP